MWNGASVPLPTRQVARQPTRKTERSPLPILRGVETGMKPASNRDVGGAEVRCGEKVAAGVRLISLDGANCSELSRRWTAGDGCPRRG